MEFIDLQAQLSHMRAKIDARIKTVLDHGQFIMGPEVGELEQQLASYVNVKHCVTCANGTDALQLSLMALGVGPDDIVFTTAFSFFATAEVIPLVGATPYFVDIESDTYNICPASLEQAIIDAQKCGKGRPAAVIAVDMFGLPANYPQLQKICDKYQLHLIEDGAQGFGGSIGEQKVGSFGHIATTSFFPAKPLGCFGDGGALFTNDDDLAAVCRSLRVHGKGEDKYHNVRIGLNSRLDTIQAAILLEKLTELDNERARKQQLAQRYSQALPEKYQSPSNQHQYNSAWAQYTVQCKSLKLRELSRDILLHHGVPTVVYYPIPLNRQPALTNYASSKTDNSNQVSECVFSLPMHGYMNEDTQQQIERAINALQDQLPQQKVTLS